MFLNLLIIRNLLDMSLKFLPIDPAKIYNAVYVNAQSIIIFKPAAVKYLDALCQSGSVLRNSCWPFTITNGSSSLP